MAAPLLRPSSSGSGHQDPITCKVLMCPPSPALFPSQMCPIYFSVSMLVTLLGFLCR